MIFCYDTCDTNIPTDTKLFIARLMICLLAWLQRTSTNCFSLGFSFRNLAFCISVHISIQQIHRIQYLKPITSLGYGNIGQHNNKLFYLILLRFVPQSAQSKMRDTTGSYFIFNQPKFDSFLFYLFIYSSFVD